LLDTSCFGSFTRNKEESKRDLLDRIQENTEGWENDKDREYLLLNLNTTVVRCSRPRVLGSRDRVESTERSLKAKYNPVRDWPSYCQKVQLARPKKSRQLLPNTIPCFLPATPAVPATRLLLNGEPNRTMFPWIWPPLLYCDPPPAEEALVLDAGQVPVASIHPRSCLGWIWPDHDGKFAPRSNLATTDSLAECSCRDAATKQRFTE
jgi:hypothetical protein